MEGMEKTKAHDQELWRGRNDGCPTGIFMRFRCVEWERAAHALTTWFAQDRTRALQELHSIQVQDITEMAESLRGEVSR